MRIFKLPKHVVLLRYMSQKKQVRDYTAVFERNEDGGYTVSVPALPGLVTEGDDLADARAMTEDAILCYLEGLDENEVPEESEVGNFRVRVEV